MMPRSSVLLAEDDENDVCFLERAFATAKIGEPLQITRDGEEAIQYLAGEGDFADRNLFPLPALLILDLKMPRKTGLDVLAWLHRHETLSCLPVVVFSSSAQPMDIEQAYRLGANAFVVKPSSVTLRNEFARTVKEFWLQFNVPPMVCVDGHEAARRAHAAHPLPPSP